MCLSTNIKGSPSIPHRPGRPNSDWTVLIQTKNVSYLRGSGLQSFGHHISQLLSCSSFPRRLLSPLFFSPSSAGHNLQCKKSLIYFHRLINGRRCPGDATSKHLYLSFDQLSLDQSVSTTQLISCPLDNPHPSNGEETETRDWASLPGDLLVSVASRLTSLADFFAFRRVCTSWRSNVIPSAHALSSQSPLIMLHVQNRLSCYDEDEVPDDMSETDVEYLDRPSFDVVFLDVMHQRFYKSESSSSWRSFNLVNFSHGYLAVAYGDGHILLPHFFTSDKIWLTKTRKPFSDKNIIFSENPLLPVLVCSLQFL